jgi:hypothetical protein
VTGNEATACSPGSPRWFRPPAAPFPPPGPPRQVPRLPRYYDAVRLPVPLSPVSVAFARRYPAVRLWFRSRRSRSPNRGPGVRQPVPSSGNFRREASRASQVPRQPWCPYALFFDPGRTRHTRPIRCAGAAPAMSTTKAPTTKNLSGLHGTAWGLAVYASSCALPHPTQNSLPVAGQLSRAGLVTRRVATKGFNASSTSSFPELSWRKDIHLIRIANKMDVPFCPSPFPSLTLLPLLNVPFCLFPFCLLYTERERPTSSCW